MCNVFTWPHIFSVTDKIHYWSYLKIWKVLNHPEWCFCHAYSRKEWACVKWGNSCLGTLVQNSFILFGSKWKADATVLCKYLTCWSWHSLPKALLFFSLFNTLCTSDMWNHLPWNHIPGSRDKSASFILSGLVWGLWSLLPCSCYVMWTRSHVVQWLQLISFLFSVDDLLAAYSSPYSSYEGKHLVCSLLNFSDLLSILLCCHKGVVLLLLLSVSFPNLKVSEFMVEG